MASLSTATTKPSFVRLDAAEASTTPQNLVAAIKRDGGVIVENLISRQLAEQIRADLKPHFDSDIPDLSGFFPVTTQRATGLFNVSDACVELACNPLYIDVANELCSSSLTYWEREKRITVSGKPIVSSTVAFRVNPGGKQQVLHRDDDDYHPHDKELPVMIGCVTALTRTTRENGATIGIPGSHLWDSERRPYDEEAVPAELEPGDAFIFLGNLYHAGGQNITQNEYRETVGIFLCKPTLRPAENQFLMVPLERARQLTPQAQRLLGYGVCKPSLGFMNYQDPMKVLFGVEDEETVLM